MKRRTKIAPGIYQDAHGYSVVARVGTYPHQLSTPEIRYPPDTPLPTMVARWHHEKMRLTDERAKAGGGPVHRGTLAADVRTYLETAHLTKQRRAERADQLGNAPVRAHQAGATTYLLKDTLSSDLVRVIREVHAGEHPACQVDHPQQGCVRHVGGERLALSSFRDVGQNLIPACVIKGGDHFL
jgi:hypothetical protein